MGEIDPKKYFLLITFLLSLICILSFGILQRDRDEIKYEKSTDTIYSEIIFHDTIKIESPIHIEKHIIKFDTIYCSDTLYYFIPIEQKIYNDSLYTAYISGYNVNLDSIFLYKTETEKIIEITNNITKYKKHKFSIGPYIGIGTNDFRNYQPEIGIGVQWNIFNF